LLFHVQPFAKYEDHCHHYQRHMKVRSHTEKIPRLRKFRRPVRIIFGDADYTLNSGVARTFHEFLPESELFLIPGARHFVQLDEPEQVGRLILAMPSSGSQQA
jgi:pimeloyl-ACP methyl ester carboxylesterase